ncbi:hypothetical protein [Streptomyces regalis]|uniref:STAS domain-containing protein n=1 Tax=Streptomyces regalis TaxID=68262 RepID=A0A0X3VG97_9ACTN|nr:hypothetical protein [Streptomyces regalis]KUL43775.1 hypothetical protein ADL12_06805 [Streptomyces regalis]
MAVSGTLGPATEHHVRQRLSDRAKAGTYLFFLDVRDLHCAEQAARDGLMALFPVGSRVRFHLVGAPAELRASIGADPRFVLHTDLEAAWNRWSKAE